MERRRLLKWAKLLTACAFGAWMLAVQTYGAFKGFTRAEFVDWLRTPFCVAMCLAGFEVIWGGHEAVKYYSAWLNRHFAAVVITLHVLALAFVGVVSRSWVEFFLELRWLLLSISATFLVKGIFNLAYANLVQDVEETIERVAREASGLNDE
jgi:hypothetical protein